MRRLAIALIATLLAAAAAADSGSWGTRGFSRRFVVAGNLVFAADGRGLTAYDVSSSSEVKRIAVSESEDESLDVARIGANELALLTRDSIDRYTFGSTGALTLESSQPLGDVYTSLASGTTLLAGSGTGGVTLWSPMPGLLAMIGKIPIDGRVTAMAFHGDRLYVGVEHQGVFAYDTDGSGPLSILPVIPNAIAIEGDTLSVAGGPNGLVIADISNDATPNVVSRTGAGEVNLNRVAVAGTRLYATELDDVVHVYDVSSPVEPRLAATFHEPAQALAATGPRLFVSGSIFDNFGLPTGTGVPLRVYDVGATGAPRATGDFRELAGPVSGVATNGTVAWVVDPPYLRVIDVSSPAAARELTSLKIEGLQDRIRIEGDRAIVYGRGDVQLFDIADPYKPKFLGVFHSFGRPPSNAAFAGIGNTIVEGNPWSGFHVIDFDLLGPENPAQIAGIKGHYKEIVGRGLNAYIFEETTQLRIVDLSVRGEANVVNEIPSNSVQAEIVDGTDRHPEQLVVSLPDGVRVFSLADPAHPVESHFVRMQGGLLFGSSGNTAFLGTDGTLTALDLVTGTAQATTMTVRSPMQIAAAPNGKVVVADRYGLRIFGPKTAAPPPPPPAGPVRRRPSASR
ncbi:MAG TPA: hypothetical protein VN605_15035 [Thermoanaerobaculia bacterium]|nr:hypothetical protein [Thermoanaerobaculia bacterium]